MVRTARDFERMLAFGSDGLSDPVLTQRTDTTPVTRTIDRLAGDG